MHLLDDGQKGGRNMKEANYVYNVILDTFKRVYAFVGFVTISNQLNVWSRII
jgi:hypothetical protein